MDDQIDYLTPIGAIHDFCIECSGSQKQPQLCQNAGCRFYLYRAGTNPHRKNIGGRDRKKDLSNLSCQNNTKIKVVQAIPDVITIDGIKYKKAIP